MSNHFNEEFNAIVVERKNYRECDMLVTMLTDRFGFKNFFIRGAHKRGFKMGAAILPFSHGTYIGQINDNGLSFISATRDVEQYQTISQDIQLNAYASYILGLTRQAFTDSTSSIQLWFNQIEMALQLINEECDPEIITNIVEVKLLGCFGVQPNWQGCVVCNRTNLPFDYSESYGGLLCQNHWNLDPNRLHLDQRTIYFLRKFSVIDLTKLNSIKVKDATKFNLRRALDEIYNNQVGVYVKAKKFLDQMSSWDKIFDHKKDLQE
ncbi:DNA repair protein RecO [Ligilactobacillus sp. LYQ135]